MLPTPLFTGQYCLLQINDDDLRQNKDDDLNLKERVPTRREPDVECPSGNRRVGSIH